MQDPPSDSQLLSSSSDIESHCVSTGDRVKVGDADGDGDDKGSPHTGDARIRATPKAAAYFRTIIRDDRR